MPAVRPSTSISMVGRAMGICQTRQQCALQKQLLGMFGLAKTVEKTLDRVVLQQLVERPASILGLDKQPLVHRLCNVHQRPAGHWRASI